VVKRLPSAAYVLRGIEMKWQPVRRVCGRANFATSVM
jgi:hypothetical protein